MDRLVSCFRGAVSARARIVVIAMLAGGSAVHADTPVIEGQAHIVNTATVEIWGQRIRLEGIVAPDPESAQGRAGRRYLQRLVSTLTVRCLMSGPFSRAVVPGRCFVGGVDIGESLVTAGHARRAPQTGER